MVALRMGIKYCRVNNLFPLILETDSQVVKNMVDGSWDTPWEVVLEIKRIQVLMKVMEVAIEHTLREGNKVADFF